MNFKDNSIEIGLKIHIFSLTLRKDLIKDTDEIRMSITSKPDKRKHYYYFSGKQFQSPDLICHLNITNMANEIIIVFRKKNFIEGHPIIGSAIIESCNLPKIPQNINQLSIEKKSTDVKNIKILNPYQLLNNKNKKEIGEMKIQISVIPPDPDSYQSNSKDNNLIIPLKNLINNNNPSSEPKCNSYLEYILF